MFEGFENRRIKTSNAEINVMLGGEGPPLLLIHGYPQTHVMWHRVAPVLAQHFSLILPDMPGYGASKGPVPDDAHVNYSKRAIALEMMEMMDQLGHPSFALAGHDRGGRLAYRITLDHQERVTKLATLDIVPTLETWERMGWANSLNAFHWPFLAQGGGIPEHMIGLDPDFWHEQLIRRWAGDFDKLDPRAVQVYLAQFHDPEVIAASCADYRAGPTTDSDHDRADRDASKRITCPLLVLWGEDYLRERVGSPVDIWQHWAGVIEQAPLQCGHFLAEEQPETCGEAMLKFFKDQ